MSNKFSGKIYGHDFEREEAIRFALKWGDHPDVFQFFVDESQNLGSGITGLAAVFRHHGETYWQEKTATLTVLDYCFEDENERDLMALRMALVEAFDRVKEDEQEVLVFVDSQYALDRLDEYRVGDGKWGSDTLDDILYWTEELQKRGKDVTLRWTPSTEHDFCGEQINGDYIGFGAYGHNWADFMARRAAGNMDRPIEPSHVIRFDLYTRPRELGTALGQIETDEEAAEFVALADKAAEDYWFFMPVGQSCKYLLTLLLLRPR